MSHKPKIAIIGLKGLPAFGGAAAVGENLIEQLKDKFKFTVLSTASHTSMQSGEINGYTQIVFKNYGKGGINTLFYYLKCLLHCLMNNYDIVHLHHAESGFITPFLRLKYKVITTFHGVYRNIDPKFSKFQNSFFRFSEKLNILYSNQVVSVSQPDKEYILEKYKKEITYIPNGITIEPDELITQPATEKYIFFAAGRIYQIKGLHLFLEAAKKINLSILIKIAGDIEQVEAYKKEIEELQTGLNIEYLGLIKNKQELNNLIKNAELFIFPSLTEAMSMMLLEVVAIKTPVIASDIPSNKAIFTNDELCFFKTNNSDDLAKQLKYALENKNEMLSRSEKAYNKLKNQYTWETVSTQYESAYQNLLKKK